MKRIILSIAFLLGLSVAAQAQCIAVGGINSVPVPGLNCLSEPSVASFSATGIGIVPAASVTDIACIQGAAGIVIRVQRITLSGTAGTQIVVPATLMKRASLDTGGTPATSTALPVAAKKDSSSAAAKASLNAWTANPTIVDSSPGIIGSSNLLLSKTDGTNGIGAPATVWDFSEMNYSTKPILRTAAQALCINLNSTSPSSGLVNVTFDWTEAAQ